MPADRITRPALTLRVFSREEQQELRRLADERRCDLNSLVGNQLGPLRKLLQQRLRERSKA